MPTVLRINGYRFYFYSHEPGEPPHVHVDKAGCSAKVWLDPIIVARPGTFKAGEIAEITSIVRQHRAKLMEAWHGHFGGGR